MTFCIGIRVESGVVLLADTRIVKGSEVSQKSKLSMFAVGESDVSLMTSGLRSVRDKVVARVDDRLTADASHLRLHDFASEYGAVLRRVRDEDEASLAASGLQFNSHAILGGQLAGDATPALLYVYPEGNWVEATPDSPYFIIGRTFYGKPILDRLLTFESTLEQALTLAYLAFDATRASATDVDFPIDVAVLAVDAGRFTRHRYEMDDLGHLHAAWHDHLRTAIDDLPQGWADPLIVTPTDRTTP